jgi:hypothetical protein
MKTLTNIIRFLIGIALMLVAILPFFATTLTLMLVLAPISALAAYLLVDRVQVWSMDWFFDMMRDNRSDRFM